MFRKIKDFILKKSGILTLRERCDKIEKVNANLQRRITTLEKHVDPDLDKWEKINQKINESQGRLAELGKSIEIYQKNIKELSKKNEEYQQKIKALEKQNNALQYKVAALERKSQDLFWKDNILKNTVNGIEKMLLPVGGGVNREIRQPRVIVSLTSFPERISYVPIVLQRVLMQTFKPDKVILWLSEEQFPNREGDLPEKLLQMRTYGVEIRWCNGDSKAYKKVLPALKEYPNDLLIIIDDDLDYRIDFVESLYKAHLKYPQAIIASRVHQITLDESGKLNPYEKWKKECDYDTYQMKYDWFFTGGAGTLLPPKVFDQEIFNEAVFRTFCPHADDIWLNVNAAMNKVPIVNIAINNECRSSLCIEGTQNTKLYDVNREQNDVQLKNLLKHYGERLAGTIYYGDE